MKRRLIRSRGHKTRDDGFSWSEMGKIGIAPHIVEAALNHISSARAGVAGTHNRAMHADENKAALERWAAHAQNLMFDKRATAHVVSLSGKRTE